MKPPKRKNKNPGINYARKDERRRLLDVLGTAPLSPVTVAAINSREKDPMQFRLCELAALYSEFDATGRELLMRGVIGAIEG